MEQKLHISETTINSTDARLLLEWFNKEWPDVSKYDEERLGLRIPPPIIAKLNGDLVGGLCFSSCKGMNGEPVALWLHALYVKPNHRKKSIASSLIRFAQQRNNLLYTLSDISDMYTKVGWGIISNDNHGTYLMHKNSLKNL